MDATADELAGVVDLFGGLTRPELERALAEAAFRADGRSVDEAALAETIEDALESFALVEYEPAGTEGGAESADGDDGSLFVAGPTAFPTVPEHAEDLPHILDVEPRRPDRAALGETVRDRFVEATDAAIEAGDEERIHRLIDVSYDVDAWAPVDLREDRQRLEATLE